MDFDAKTKKIKLKSVHPGVTVDWVRENVMFDLIIPHKVTTTPEPTQEYLDKLHQLDPQGIYLGKGQK
jgi:glutaconate CoA-transferase subunit B